MPDAPNESTAQQQPRLGASARRPALAAACLLIAGILIHRVVPDLPRAWLALSAAGAVIALALEWARRFAAVSTACLTSSLLLLGVAVAQLERFHFAADHVIAYTTDADRLAEIEVVIDQPPRTLIGPPTIGGRPLPPRQVTQGRVTRIKTWDGWRDATGVMLIQVTPPKPDLAFGQRVILLGNLARPDPASNPGQFDWAGYYREQRILASISAEPRSVRVVTPATRFSPLNWLRERARTALAAGFSQNHAIDHALLRALLLGDADPQIRDIQDDFQRSGTSHHLSISGLHVAVLGAVVFFACRLLRLSPRRSAVVMMGFVLLYGLVALPAPPVIRSIILCLAFGVGVICRRSVDGIQLLALTVFAMLVTHPLDLYNAGFQLSFGTVLGLMVYATRLTEILDRRSEDERALFLAGIPPTRVQSIRLWFRGHLIEAVAAGLVAWAVSAPLIVEHFDQLNPYAVPAGMVLALPVFAAMVAGLFKIILTLLLPWFAPAWAWLAAAPVELMRWTVSWLAKLPGGDLPMPGVPVAVVLIFYALLALPLLPATGRRVRWALRAGPIAACAAALMLPLLVGLFSRAGTSGSELRLTLLSVGAGQCAVLELPGPSNQAILIDAGSSTIADLPRRCLEPFLRHRGIARLDAIYISHANLDHFSAVARAVEDYHPTAVSLTPYFERHAAKNHAATLMLEQLAGLGCPLQRVAAGQTIRLADNCTLEVLWPPADVVTGSTTTLDANNSCQVMRLTFAGRSILFTGDIQAPAEKALLASSANLRSDVLIAPHHGSAEETTAKFLDAVGARTILASNDRTLSGKQREFEKLVVQNQENDGAGTPRILYRTHRSGAITVRIASDGKIDLSTFLNAR